MIGLSPVVGIGVRDLAMATAARRMLRPGSLANHPNNKQRRCGAPSGLDGGVRRVEWRTDGPLVGKEIGSGQHRRLFADPKAHSSRQGYGRATARSGRAMLRTDMACNRVVAIDLDARASGGHGKRSCMSPHISVCAGVRAQRKRDQDDASGRESMQPLAPISPVLPSDHCAGDAHNPSIGYHTRPLKP
jgi:hypothetical protein